MKFAKCGYNIIRVLLSVFLHNVSWVITFCNLVPIIYKWLMNISVPLIHGRLQTTLYIWRTLIFLSFARLFVLSFLSFVYLLYLLFYRSIIYPPPHGYRRLRLAMSAIETTYCRFCQIFVSSKIWPFQSNERNTVFSYRPTYGHFSQTNVIHCFRIVQNMAISVKRT